MFSIGPPGSVNPDTKPTESVILLGPSNPSIPVSFDASDITPEPGWGTSTPVYGITNMTKRSLNRNRTKRCCPPVQSLQMRGLPPYWPESLPSIKGHITGYLTDTIKRYLMHRGKQLLQNEWNTFNRSIDARISQMDPAVVMAIPHHPPQRDASLAPTPPPWMESLWTTGSMQGIPRCTHCGQPSTFSG